MSDRVTLHLGDCREVLASLPESSVDAVVTDPPYELGFMGKGWDSAGVSFRPETWAAALRVLKPGGHLLAFGGSRTFHRIAVAIEDAGFEVRDTLSWLYGQGFPKSLDVSKAIDAAAGAERGEPVLVDYPGRAGWNSVNGTPRSRDEYVHGTPATQHLKRVVTAPVTDCARKWQGWGTALKPAWEPIILARKPLAGTVAANVHGHGTGALNIDGCRIKSGEVFDGTGREVGRWPANVVLDEEAAALLDAQTGDLGSNHRPNRGALRGLGYTGGSGAAIREGHADSGGASRFFYVAKASRSERDAGCESLPARSGGEATDREDGSAGTNSPRAGAGRTGGARNIHPTVKPVALMRWLVRLVTPPGGVVLDPFMGSGSTGVAVMQEGRRFDGIEQSAEYMEIARCRIEHAMAECEQTEKPRQAALFTEVMP